jgi:thioredoxin 1
MTKAVSDADFDKTVLNSSVPVVVDFWAEWCGPCKQIAPALEEISKTLGDKVQIVKMNVDENQEQPSKYGIRAIPTLIIFKDGKVLAQKTGALPKKALQDWITSSTGSSV